MKTVTVLVASMVAGLAAAAAPAETLVFTYTTPGDTGPSASWTQSSTPAVVAYYSNIYTTVSVTDGELEVPGSPPFMFSEVYFAAGGADGGFDILGSGVSDSGPQIYTSPETAPVFDTGRYSLDGGLLTVTDVPEPAAWSMMLVGVAGIGGLLRRKGGHVRPSLRGVGLGRGAQGRYRPIAR